MATSHPITEDVSIAQLVYLSSFRRRTPLNDKGGAYPLSLNGITCVNRTTGVSSVLQPKDSSRWSMGGWGFRTIAMPSPEGRGNLTPYYGGCVNFTIGVAAVLRRKDSSE